MFKQSTGLADDGAQLERDRLKMGLDPFAAERLQGTKQPIALRFSYSRYRHSVRLASMANGACIELTRGRRMRSRVGDRRLVPLGLLAVVQNRVQQ